MIKPARFTGVARREFNAALRDMEHAAAAERLKLAVVEAARRIALRPAIGRHELKLADARYRFWSVAGFPYLIVYRSDSLPPLIVRFVHTARDLGPLLADLNVEPQGKE